jgi:hypothetical protein
LRQEVKSDLHQTKVATFVLNGSLRN